MKKLVQDYTYWLLGIYFAGFWLATVLKGGVSGLGGDIAISFSFSYVNDGAFVVTMVTGAVTYLGGRYFTSTGELPSVSMSWQLSFYCYLIYSALALTMLGVAMLTGQEAGTRVFGTAYRAGGDWAQIPVSVILLSLLIPIMRVAFRAGAKHRKKHAEKKASKAGAVA